MLTEALRTNKKMRFSTKAGTLSDLLPMISSARVLPLSTFTVSEWSSDRKSVLLTLRKLDWFHHKLVVRSSAIGEDSQESSMAGQYTSVINIDGEEAFLIAVDEVITSFGDDDLNHQILVQPYLSDVIMSGVAFGQDPNTGGPYVVINYADDNDDTTAITSGKSNHKCYIQHHQFDLDDVHVKDYFLFEKIMKLMIELEGLFDTNCLDVEFAINKNHELYLFQVRPLINKIKCPISIEMHQKAMERISNRIALGMKPHLYLHGQQTVYGVMPDWNPAEIIGIRPKPLALSLYRELVTNTVWAYQRDNYGYANLRSFPLLVDFEGLPYIDVRVSFNSFLPKGLSSELAERLVNYYLERLIEAPSLHDKVEFEIVFSCYTPDLKQRLTILSQYGFSEDDRETIYQALIQLTNQIIHNQQGLWQKDLEKIEQLSVRQRALFQSDLDPISKMYWILEDCKRYGTLPFAGLARAGFIAVQILKSFVNVGILNEEEYARFLSSVNSVSSTMNDDFINLSRNDFLEKYGHLRPGTYDILSPRYDEAPELYFDWNVQRGVKNEIKQADFSLTIQQLRKIQAYVDQDGLQITALELLEFIKFAIESREYSKFIFSRSVSEFLKIFTDFSAQLGMDREDCAHIGLPSVISLYGSSVDPEETLYKSMEMGKKQYQITSAITLPPLITAPSQAWAFELPDTQPNFITQKKSTGNLAFLDTHKHLIADAILMIPSADPGYDWIFSHKIAGFITKYGGINSHMAIRAGELGIPAIIGAGEIKFNQWSQAKKIHMDCLNKQVHLL